MSEKNKKHEKIVCLDEIVDTMIKQGLDMPKRKILLIYEEMREALLVSLSQGYNVNLDGFVEFNIDADIKGVFDSPEAEFDPEKHSITVETHTSPEFENEVLGLLPDNN